MLPPAIKDVYKPILVSNSSFAFPYGTCTNAYDTSCFTFEGPTLTSYKGYTTLSFVLVSKCKAPLQSSCTQDLAQIKINSSGFKSIKPKLCN